MLSLVGLDLLESRAKAHILPESDSALSISIPEIA